MASIDPKARARRIAQEVLTQGDLAAAGELFAPGCVHHGAFGAGTTRWIGALRRAFPDLRAMVEDEIAEGATVAQQLTLTGTQRRAILDVSPSGRRVSWKVALFLRVGPDGTFAEEWTIWDRLDLLRQLGGVPANWMENHNVD